MRWRMRVSLTIWKNCNRRDTESTEPRSYNPSLTLPARRDAALKFRSDLLTVARQIDFDLGDVHFALLLH